MRNWSINNKVIALAFLPTLIVSILLGGYFTFDKIYNINHELQTLGNSMISQLSPAAKFALVKNRPQILQGLTNSTLENSKVAAAAIFDANGKLVAFSGPDYLMPADLAAYKANLKKSAANTLKFVQPLTIQQITVSDYEGNSQSSTDLVGKNLGWIALDISNTRADYIKTQTILISLIILTLGLIISLLIIRVLMHSINRPILRINKALKQLHEGRFQYLIPELKGKEFDKTYRFLNKLNKNYNFTKITRLKPLIRKQKI